MKIAVFTPIHEKKKLANKETLRSNMKNLSIELLQLHELFVVTIKALSELEQKFVMIKSEIVQSCVENLSR